MKTFLFFFLVLFSFLSVAASFEESAIVFTLERIQISGEDDKIADREDFSITVKAQCADNETDILARPIFIPSEIKQLETKTAITINSGHLEYCFNHPDNKFKEILIKVVDEEQNLTLGKVYITSDFKVKDIEGDRPTWKKPIQLRKGNIATIRAEAPLKKSSWFSSEVIGKVKSEMLIQRLEVGI